ncbi:MAG: hypothetical protein E6J90_26310 [Deltaproteobacteria bacterium]|nr:MAG: hypothetical protein E6J90_26310 [Deltaproteobacteria bacterium]
MSAKSPEEIWGTEYDWIGVDADGHVALFSTAGGGYAPREFLRDTDAHDEAISAILSLPASTTARLAPELAPQLENTWKLVAERGLFAFDADLYGGPYRVAAAPELPVRAAELPEAVAKALRGLEFRHLRFADLSVISEADLLGGRPVQG